MQSSDGQVSFGRLFLFFIPLGLTVVLINLSHVIINRTLASAADPTTVLAGYALAMSLLALTERPSVLLRQTCSALVRDKVSYRAVRFIGLSVICVSITFGALVAYTPFGRWVFNVGFGAEMPVSSEAIAAWQALMFLSVFSGLRCLFQGVIIYRMRTKWMMVGMVFRLSGMFLLSRYVIHIGVVSALQGAFIFVAGMMIEAFVSWLECRKLVRAMPVRAEGHEITRPRQVLPFYRPLLLSSLIVVWVMPILNTMLGHTEQASLAIASFSVATSLMNLILGFFTYFHQIALHFGKAHAGQVRRFVLTLGFLPILLFALLSFSPAGPWALKHLLNVHGELMEASLQALRGFLPLVFIFPWLDTLNGFVLGRGETKLMFASQTANTFITTLLIVVLVFSLPGWNGMLGSLAQSGGLAAEFILLAWLYRRNRRNRVTATVAP